MTITEFLEARIAEDEADATPDTNVISGGWPAPEVPNCVGPDGRGCEAGWKMTPPRGAPAGWWKAPDVLAVIRAHGMTHITPRQARVLAECAAKRAIIEEHELGERSDGTRRSVGCVLCNYNRDYGWDETGPCKTLRAIAAVYKDHPDYRQEWD